MNVATVVRRLEESGFTHDQATTLAEVLHEEVTSTLATKEYVGLAIDRASERLESMIHQESKSTIKWVAGMMVVQTVAILTGTVGLVKWRCKHRNPTYAELRCARNKTPQLRSQSVAQSFSQRPEKNSNAKSTSFDEI